MGFRCFLVFVWIYGIFLGGYQYSLKMYLFEKVRARNFASAWSFVQFSQGVSVVFGVPLIGYINSVTGRRDGYIFSGVSVIIGGVIMTLIDVHKRLHKSR